MLKPNDHLTRSGWVPVVNGEVVPNLLPTKAIALKEAKRLGDMAGAEVVSAEPFSYTITQEQYREMLRPYVSIKDTP